MKYNIYIIIMDNNMNIEKPRETGFTIYSKSGCPNCTRIKKIMIEKKQTFIVKNCDEYFFIKHRNEQL